MDNDRKYKRYNDFKLLKRFLIDNDCYHSYMFNIINRHKCEGEDLFNFIISQNIYSYINGVFIWNLTKEGYDYWYEINNKWEQLINKLYIKT